MSAEYDIVINLVSAAIGVVSGAGWAYAVNMFRYRRHRAFWRFLKEPTIFVIGDLAPNVLLGTLPEALKEVAGGQRDPQAITQMIMGHLDTQEISGLIGRGDLDAIVSMVAKFASTRLPARPVVLHPSQVRDRIGHNLILIGGKDTNSLTDILAPRLGCRLETLMNENGHNVVRDSRLNVDHPVIWQGIPGASGEVLRVDYGILVRGRNPYNPEREILIMAGAHGLGSFAAAEVCLNSKYEKRLYSDFKEYAGNFECLVSYKRVDGGPANGQVTIDLEFSRGISAPSTN